MPAFRVAEGRSIFHRPFKLLLDVSDWQKFYKRSGAFSCSCILHYRANFRDPSSYFLAQQFPMRNKDVLYAAKANSVEVVKFINYATAITSGASTVTADAAITRHAVTYLGKGSANGC